MRVAATILSLLGLSVPRTMDGGVLSGLMRPAGGTAPATPIYVECDDWLAVRGARHKLITYRNHPDRDELYDLVADPGERKSLVITEPAVRDELRGYAHQYWQTFEGTNTTRPPVERLDEPTRERLRALGYVQ